MRPTRRSCATMLPLSSRHPETVGSPMTESTIYHEGNRRMQDAFGSRPMADRIEAKLTRTAFSEADRELIDNSIYFFLATADADGRPDCSYKGGAPGFVRITGPDELAFPDYDGNGMFKSLGNMAINPNVGLLFSASSARPAITRAKPKPKCGLWRVGIARCGSSGSSQHTRAPRLLRAGTLSERALVRNKARRYGSRRQRRGRKASRLETATVPKH